MSRRAILQVAALLVRLALQEVDAVPFSQGTLVALRLSNDGIAPVSSSGVAVVIDEFSTAGVKLQSLSGVTSCVVDMTSYDSGFYGGVLTLSGDGQLASYVCYEAAVGASVASATRHIVSVDANAVFYSPVSSSIVGVGAFAAVKSYNSVTRGYYEAGVDGVYYIPPGGGTAVPMTTSVDVTSVGIFFNSLCEHGAWEC